MYKITHIPVPTHFKCLLLSFIIPIIVYAYLNDDDENDRGGSVVFNFVYGYGIYNL